MEPSSFNHSVMIATFCNHRPSAGFHDSIVRLASVHRKVFPESRMSFVRLGSATLVWEGRNRLAHMALSEGFDFILFIDSDISFSIEDVQHLCERSLYLPYEKDNTIRSGVYVDRRLWSPIARTIGEETIGKLAGLERIFKAMKAHRTLPVHGVPMGFTLISTRILLDMGPPWFFEPYQEGTLNHIGEDYYFCQKAVKMGIQPVLDCSIFVDHESDTVIQPQSLLDMYISGGREWINTQYANILNTGL